MNNIAIIPARSGSKGLRDKNIRLLNGKPLIAYTIEAAIKSNMFSEIFVSTNSEKYAEIAIKYGADVPFLRSEELSSDTASSWAVVSDALERYEKIDRYFDSFALLQPTSPLRTQDDIVAGYQLLEQKNANAVVSVCEVDHSPLWCNTLPEDLSMEKFVNRNFQDLPRQSLPVYYRINGAIYIAKCENFKLNTDIYATNCYAYIMKKESSVDIDSELDFVIAKTLLSSQKSD